MQAAVKRESASVQQRSSVRSRTVHLHAAYSSIGAVHSELKTAVKREAAWVSVCLGGGVVSIECRFGSTPCLYMCLFMLSCCRTANNLYNIMYMYVCIYIYYIFASRYIYILNPKPSIYVCIFTICIWTHHVFDDEVGLPSPVCV